MGGYQREKVKPPLSGIFPLGRPVKVLLALGLMVGSAIAVAGIAFLGGFDKGDWVDKKWQGSSEEWKRGYRDYYDKDVGNDYRDVLRDIDHDLWYIRLKQESLSEAKVKGYERYDLEREIPELQQKIKDKTQVASAAKEKLEQRTTNAADYWDGWKFAEMEVHTAVLKEEFHEDWKARKEGEHLKKVLEYAR